MICFDMTEQDIAAAKSNWEDLTPLNFTVCRYFKEAPHNVDVTPRDVVVWGRFTDYASYRYSDEDAAKVREFLETWDDYVNDRIPEFDLAPISFRAEEKKLKLIP